MKGLTDTLKYITTPTNRQKICSRADLSHEGIHMMTKKDRYGEFDPNRGLRLKNTVFSDFGKHFFFTECKYADFAEDSHKPWFMFYLDKNTMSCLLGSWPISFSDIRTDSHFDYTSSVGNVTISDSRGLFIDACTALSRYGVDDIVINDLDGALASSIMGTSSTSQTSGVFVSNTDFMKFSDCITYASNCVAYCPNLCLRTVTYAVEQFGTDGVKLLVTSEVHVHYNLSVLINNVS